MPGFEALQRQQQAFLKSVMGGFGKSSGPEIDDETEVEAKPKAKAKAQDGDDLAQIKKQLAELQTKLSKL